MTKIDEICDVSITPLWLLFVGPLSAGLFNLILFTNVHAKVWAYLNVKTYNPESPRSYLGTCVRWIMIFYSFAMFVFTFYLDVKDFLDNISDINSGWDSYQCFVLTAANSSNYKWWVVNLTVMACLGVDGKSLISWDDVGQLGFSVAMATQSYEHLWILYGQYFYQMTIRLFFPEDPGWTWDQWFMIKQLRLVTCVETLILLPLGVTHFVPALFIYIWAFFLLMIAIVCLVCCASILFSCCAICCMSEEDQEKLISADSENPENPHAG
eukprot:UN27483